MRFLSYFYLSALALTAAASPTSVEFQENSKNSPKNTPFNSDVHVRATDLHPDDFPNIQAVHAFHDLIKDILPSIYQVAEIAGIKMDDLLSGTPLTWDEEAAEKSDLIEKRSPVAIEFLLASASKSMFGFISRFAEMANKEMLGSIVDTLIDYLGA